MIDVKQAVKVSYDFISQLYGSDRLKELTLEEVELTEDERFWLVTLALSAPVVTLTPLEAFGIQQPKREYKIIKVRADSGVVQSMKIREV